MNSAEILSIQEIQTVLSHLRKKKHYNGKQNLVIFRLSCCCGLRRCEIAGLNVGDLIVTGDRPCIRVRKAIAKGKKARLVPLWWDSGTLEDLTRWKSGRLAFINNPNQPFISSMLGTRYTPANVGKHFKTAIGVLGDERVSQISIHSGRHTFCSLALAGGRSLVEVRDAAGHASISTTSIYLHSVNSDCPDLFR